MDTEHPAVNAIRLGLIYLIIITATIIVQSIANWLMRITANALQPRLIPWKLTITMIVLLYIVFLAIFIDILIWTAVLLAAGVFTDFLLAFTFATDNFTTLGGEDTVEAPWEFVGPVMSLNGIIIIAFAVSSMYDIYIKIVNAETETCE